LLLVGQEFLRPALKQNARNAIQIDHHEHCRSPNRRPQWRRLQQETRDGKGLRSDSQQAKRQHFPDGKGSHRQQAGCVDLVIQIELVTGK